MDDDGPVDLNLARREARRKKDRDGGGGGPDGPRQGFEPVDWDGGPVTPLGHRQGHCYYVTRAGEVIAMTWRDHSKAGIRGLFGGKLAWLKHNFPRYDSDGSPKVGTWNEDTAAAALIAKCDDEGIFDPDTPVRGCGVWKSAAWGLIVHSGSTLFYDGADHNAGEILDRKIYAAAAAAERPAFERPASAEDGRRLRAGLGLWRFASSVGADILLGFIGAGMLGGAPDWRVHVLVLGKWGSGKSWLSDYVKATFGGGAMDANDVTEAALRQAFTNQARVILLDEAESDETSATRIQAIVTLLRRMSGGAGARAMRGSPGGQVTTFNVTGCAYLAAILPPALKPQDRSRIAVVELDALPVGEAAIAGRQEALDAIAWAVKNSARLRARALAGYGRFLDTFEVYRAAFLRQGLDPREAERMATILAGRDLLIYDHVPDSDSVEETVARFADYIGEAQREADEDGEGQECLAYLMTAQSEMLEGGRRPLISELVMRAFDKADAQARVDLARHGMRVEGWQEEDPRYHYLVVANRHGVTQRILKPTRWADGRHIQALAYLPSAKRTPKALRFGGILSRGVMIGAWDLPKRDDPEPDEPGPVDINSTEPET